MTPEQFAYWLQGFAELQSLTPTQDQWRSIREHLATVFNKVTPNLGAQNHINDSGKILGHHMHDYQPPHDRRVIVSAQQQLDAFNRQMVNPVLLNPNNAIC